VMSGSETSNRISSLAPLAILICCFTVTAPFSAAQNAGVERNFPQSTVSIDKAIQLMQSGISGRLPALEGFAAPGEHPLERYKRGFYQAKIEVRPAPSGGAIVRVTVEITAWYDDPAGHSGYQVLPSNGRLEADLLDQLADQLAGMSAQLPAQAVRTGGVPLQVRAQNKSAATAQNGPPAALIQPKSAPAPKEPAVRATDTHQPETKTAEGDTAISAPMPRIPEPLSKSLAQTLAEAQKTSPDAANPKKDAALSTLEAQAESLQEILKNQVHPKNLVAVKKDGTPVVATPSLNAKTLFLASAHDEFEMIDFNEDWVHVRISGLSRGWIWRNSLELPDSIPDGDTASNAPGAATASDLFRVTREEEAEFPGDWPPLLGKTVKIVSVEKVNDNSKDTGPQLRLEYAKSILEKSYAEVAANPGKIDGIVLIFDSSDGGMIAATLTALQQWRAGTLSDAALWHQCFFDPPESFTASTSSDSPAQ